MKGMNFEEWKALVQKRREGMTHSEIYNHESQLGVMSKNDPEYGQTYTITYNVTGNFDVSNLPTEIKSARTLKLNIPVPYGATGSVDANVPHTYENGVLTIQDVQQDIEIAINISDVLYENAKLGDYLYSDWTFGPTEKAGYLGRCIGLATENEGKSVWCSPQSSSWLQWSTEKVDTELNNFVNTNTPETDFNGKSNTELLLSLGTDKYPAAAYASELFQGNGYLPAAGELYKYSDQIKTYVNSANVWSSTEYSSDNVWYVNTYTGAVLTIGKTNYYYVLALIQLSGKPGKPVNNNGHEYVDLGLPSGTLWATMNVGATSETDYGLYFQWGDTQGYTAEQVGNDEGLKSFRWSDYKFNPSGDGSTFTKYNATDGKTVLDPEDDAAIANWGGSWKMPTVEQFQELLNTANCTNVWTTVDGVKGRLFTSVKNGNTLFIPAAGRALNGNSGSIGSYSDIWSSSLSSVMLNKSSHCAYVSDSGVYMVNSSFRYYGFSVRGVVS